MKTTPADRAAWRAELTRKHPDMCAGDATMALGVLDDLTECETRCAALQAENDANATWLNETWPTIADRELGELVRERDEALAKVAALTQERDMLRTALGYWHGVRLERVVRDRDENAAIASAAMTAGLAECERLRDEIESLADSLDTLRTGSVPTAPACQCESGATSALSGSLLMCDCRSCFSSR